MAKAKIRIVFWKNGDVVVRIRFQPGALGVVVDLGGRRGGKHEATAVVGSKQGGEALADFGGPWISPGAEEGVVACMAPVEVEQVGEPSGVNGREAVLGPASQRGAREGGAAPGEEPDDRHEQDARHRRVHLGEELHEVAPEHPRMDEAVRRVDVTDVGSGERAPINHRRLFSHGLHGCAHRSVPPF